MKKSLHPSLCSWKRTRSRKTPDIVGGFFEKLVKRVLNARNGFGCEDLRMTRIDAGIEVKSGDNRHRIRIPCDQFESHQMLATGFPEPYRNFLYAIACYRNHMPRAHAHSGSALVRCRGEQAVLRHLAENTSSVYVLDHRVIERLQSRRGHIGSTFPAQPGRKLVGLSRKFLRKFNENDGMRTLQDLGLGPSQWRVRERKVVVFVYVGLIKIRLAFNLVEVMPRDFFSGYDAVARVPHKDRPMRRTLRIPIGVTA